MQTVIVVAPILVPNVPEGHGVHKDIPCSELYVPLGHEVQDELPGVEEYVPAAHSVQDVFEVAPNAELHVPEGQIEQDV